MLHGFSGGMGTGKSLNAIKFIIENDNFADRPVYYHGIRVMLLDYKVCDSFQGWLYGVYFPANSHNKELESKLLRIETEQRLATLEDFPYLAFHYKKHEPFKQWMYWFKKLASPKRLAAFKEALAVLELDEESITYQDIEHLNLSWTAFDDPTEIHTLPAGSVILVDEVQNIWGNRTAGKAMSPDVKFVTTHRHKGIDLVYISQDFKDVDQIIRRRMQYYVHYEFIGGDWLHRYFHIEGFDPANKTELAKAEKEKVKRDNKYYGVYLSSIKHTQKVKIDPQLKKGIIGLTVGILGISAAAFYLYSWFQKQVTPASVETVQSEISTAESTENMEETKILDINTVYIEKFLPRLDALPFSAPVYDGLTHEANHYPELTCVIMHDECSCFTQQGTAYALEDHACFNIARYGYFDPFEVSSDNHQRRKTAQTRSNGDNVVLNKGGLY
ncbi:zonular occludens toxin domain-containing protein [Vibrio ziniensis]|uniref:Zona occludens toxin N-terminal domain-containing protein n=1 Tax=Vibrio ziniensis TaxID=2711221 RepID=A0A6G7CQ54_9VIBR|nr:zonular occludens toxin domain-containing protein [Vibrio ziniensis]QIH44220.1 hypothetical protein G5S32_19910 [Vibrio ziniensis]